MIHLNLKNMNMKTFFKYIPVLFLSLATMSTGAAQASDTSGGFFADYIVEITLGVALVVSMIVLTIGTCCGAECAEDFCQNAT